MSKQAKNKPKLILKRHKKTGKVWHPESGLVFKSAKDKVVIGRYENDDFIELDDEALDLCVEFGFKYDKDLVEEDEEEEAEEDDEEPVEDNKKSEPKPNNEPEPDSDKKEQSPESDNEKQTPESDEEEQTPEPTVKIKPTMTENKEEPQQPLELDDNSKKAIEHVTNVFSDYTKQISDLKNKLQESQKELKITQEKLKNIKKVLSGL